MESCHKLTLEDSRGRVPLPRFGGHGWERPVDGAAAETFDSLEGTLHDPRRWGLSSEAIGTLGERLYEFWQRFRNGFKTCTRDTSGRAYDYLRGQLTMEGERNFANIARNMTGDDGQALQHFMSNSPWSGPGVFQQIQAESTDEKAGTHNAGASRQYNGRMGKVDGCRVDTCLTYANATVGLWAMVDGELFLPQEWFGPDFAQKRQELGIPEERTFETKLALGLKMVKRAQVNRLPFELLACDALDGRDSQFRADLDMEGVWYAAQVPADTPVYVSEPQVGVPPKRSKRGRPRTRLQVLRPHTPQEMRILASSPSTPWQHMHVRQTKRKRLEADFAIRQVWTVAEGKRPRAEWLVIRRDAEGDCAYTLLNAPTDTPAPYLMAGSCQRYFTERTFEDAKTEIGWDEFQAQKYRAWKHHVALTGLALWFVAQTKLEWAQTYERD